MVGTRFLVPSTASTAAAH